VAGGCCSATASVLAVTGRLPTACSSPGKLVCQASCCCCCYVPNSSASKPLGAATGGTCKHTTCKHTTACCGQWCTIRLTIGCCRAPCAARWRRLSLPASRPAAAAGQSETARLLIRAVTEGRAADAAADALLSTAGPVALRSSCCWSFGSWESAAAPLPLLLAVPCWFCCCMCCALASLTGDLVTSPTSALPKLASCEAMPALPALELELVPVRAGGDRTASVYQPLLQSIA
jgi:hypothetical protein